MTLHVRSAAAVLLALAFANAAPVQAANTTAEDKAQKLVEGQAQAISDYAYPTHTFVKSQYVTGTRSKSGAFDLTYKIYARAGKTVGNCTLTFSFRKNGSLTNITQDRRTWFLPAFTTAQFFMELLKSEIRNDPDLKDNFFVQQIIKEADAKKLLIVVLNIKNGKL